MNQPREQSGTRAGRPKSYGALPRNFLAVLCLFAAASGMAAPANDYFTNAASLSGSAIFTNGSNAGATKEPGEPNHAGNGGGRSVWWSWTAPAEGPVTITTAGSTLDTLLAIYTGSTVSTLTLVAANDDAPVGDGTSAATFNASAGTTYRVAVDGFFGAAGAISLRLTLNSRPANDNFTNRIALSGLSTNVIGSNTNATKETGEPNHAGNPGGRSVWWTWTAPSDGLVTIATAGSSFDTLLGVYTGPALTNLTLVASNDDDPGGGPTSRVTFNTVIGATYQIAVDGYVGATGSIALSVFLDLRPANDNFANRAPLSGLSASLTASDLNATKEPGEPNHAGNLGGKSLWWTWTAPSNGNVTVSASATNFSPLLGIYTGSTLSNLTTVASSFADFGFVGGVLTFTAQAAFDATAGTTYQIAVDAYNAASGDITLNLNFTPARYALRVTPSPTSSGTINADPPPGPDGKYAAGTVVNLTASAAPGFIFSSWTGNVSAPNNLSATVTLNGSQNVTANFRAASDDFASRIVLAGSSITTTGSNLGATREPGEPVSAGGLTDKTVWWTWTAPSNGIATITTAGSSFDTVLAAYTGSDVSSLALVASNDDDPDGSLTSRVIFAAVGWTAYHIAVSGFGGSVGSIALNISLTPHPPVARPLELTAIQLLPDGRFHYRLQGSPSQTYGIETSTDLVTWIPLLATNLSDGPLGLLDSQAPSFSQRFYRVAQMANVATLTVRTFYETTDFPAESGTLIKVNGMNVGVTGTSGVFTAQVAAGRLNVRAIGTFGGSGTIDLPAGADGTVNVMLTSQGLVEQSTLVVDQSLGSVVSNSFTGFTL
ncbi:MAG TPA: hypothetical protein VGF13_21210, partial [Verrucomicrobiae bacterium]